MKRLISLWKGYLPSHWKESISLIQRGTEPDPFYIAELLFSDDDELRHIGLFTVTLIANGVAISDSFLVLSVLCFFEVCACDYVHTKKTVSRHYKPRIHVLWLFKILHCKITYLQIIRSETTEFSVGLLGWAKRKEADISVMAFCSKIVLAAWNVGKGPQIYYSKTSGYLGSRHLPLALLSIYLIEMRRLRRIWSFCRPNRSKAAENSYFKTPGCVARFFAVKS